LLKSWKKALDSCGVRIAGHRLITSAGSEKNDASITAVKRHKTAITRQHLSLPFQLLDKYGYLDGSNSIFDYGCGRGEDLKLLRERGIDAQGWDPYYQVESKKLPAQIINLGFVINVIEDRKERDQALKDSFELAERFLVVSAMKDSPERKSSINPYCDGGITQIGTFQKYFSPDELQNYVRSTLSCPVIPISQETVIAFKGEEEANRFFAKRAGLRRNIPRGSKRRAEELFLLDASAREVLGAFWDRCIELGREPLIDELTEESDIAPLGLSAKKAFEFLADKFSTDELEASAARRRQDLLVEFALGFFEKRSIYKYLSTDVQRDVDWFFKNYSSLRTKAKELLFSIADEGKLLCACRDASSDGNGYLFGDHSLQLHVDLIDRLPPILRIYVGCGERLLGGRGNAALVKVHIRSGKVTYMSYDDYEGKPIPLLLERIKVNLWTRHIDYFDYIGPFAPQPLLMKSLYLDSDSYLLEKQEPFDRQILEHNLFDFTTPHPKLEDFQRLLKNQNLQIRDFELIRLQ
jgi:DNA phosphorothioation-associated putative methyltransferase